MEALLGQYFLNKNLINNKNIKEPEKHPKAIGVKITKFKVASD